MINFITEHAEWYSVSFFSALLLYIIIIIGWFFSTDYYDSYRNGFECSSDVQGFGVFVTIVLGIAGLLNLVFGVSHPAALTANSILWLIFVLPFTICTLMSWREKIRKKRGKM